MAHARGIARKGSIAGGMLALVMAMVPVGTADAAKGRPGKPGSSTSDACGTLLPKSSGGNWSCSFVDNFDGSSLDTNKWVAQNTALSGFFVGSTCFLPGEGYAVGSGELRLTLTKRAPFDCKTPWGSVPAEYVGGAVSTYSKFSQTYGRFEARMKFPSYTGAGLHGGFWMNPQVRTYGAWPASGEIDVAEWFSGLADKAYPSLHYTGRTTADTGWNCSIGAADVFHTFAVEWFSTHMDFYYDGKLCFSRSWYPTDVTPPAPFDHAFLPSLLAVAGQGWNAPTAETPTTATTTVDYVKVWK